MESVFEQGFENKTFANFQEMLKFNKQIKKEQYKQVQEVANREIAKNSITPDLTYDECDTKFHNVASVYWLTDFTNKIWDYFYTIHKNISYEYKIQFMLENIYIHYPINLPQFYECLTDAIKNEPALQKEKRMKQNSDLLSEILDETRYVEIYRGETQKSLHQKDGLPISYTIDKRVAKFFAIRYNSRAKKTITAKVHISDVLWVANDRCEYEVILKPCCKLLDVVASPVKMTVEQIKEFCDDYHKQDED
jgi:hypothetical protein